MNRQATIDKLVACSCSGFTKDDIKMLEGASDARLLAFVAKSDAAIKAKEDEEAAEEKKKADLKAAEDAKRSLEDKVTALQGELRAAANKQLSEEEFLKVAPDSVRALVADRKAAEDAERATLVTSLKTAAANVYSEDELGKKDLPELRKLAALAKVDIDYSGRGMPRPRSLAADTTNYAPPNAYEAGLKVMQGRQ